MFNNIVYNEITDYLVLSVFERRICQRMKLLPIQMQLLLNFQTTFELIFLTTLFKRILCGMRFWIQSFLWMIKTNMLKLVLMRSGTTIQ